MHTLLFSADTERMDESLEEDQVFQLQHDSFSACAMLIEAWSTVVATSKTLLEYDLSAVIDAVGKLRTKELVAIEKSVRANALIRQQGMEAFELKK